MAIYAIGDLQGCFRPFLSLLDKLDFEPERDRLWLVGDLVNRGSDSLQTLRYIRALGEAAVTVLGNHDLHLLALAQQPDAVSRANASLRPILSAPDRDELLHWLRHRPLMHHDADLGWSMVHAGLAPDWSVQAALACAHEVEDVLRSADYCAFFEHMYGDYPDQWQGTLSGWSRLRAITNYLTRARMCHPDGRLDLHYKGPPGDAPPTLLPWFALPQRASREQRIVFGHWAALGQVCWSAHNVWGIDTGCVWGNCLSALRLDAEPQVTHIGCGACQESAP